MTRIITRVRKAETEGNTELYICLEVDGKEYRLNGVELPAAQAESVLHRLKPEHQIALIDPDSVLVKATK